MNNQQQLGGMPSGAMGGGGMPQSKEQAEQQMKQKQYAAARLYFCEDPCLDRYL